MRNCFSETTRKNAERQQREVLYGGWSVNVFRTFWQINKRSVVDFLLFFLARTPGHKATLNSTSNSIRDGPTQ